MFNQSPYTDRGLLAQKVSLCFYGVCLWNYLSVCLISTCNVILYKHYCKNCHLKNSPMRQLNSDRPGIHIFVMYRVMYTVQCSNDKYAIIMYLLDTLQYVIII